MEDKKIRKRDISKEKIINKRRKTDDNFYNFICTD